MPFTRAMARAMMPRLVDYGWPGRKIIRWLDSYGFTYTRATMRSDIRKYQGLARSSIGVLRLPETADISRSLISETILPRSEKFRVYGRALYTHIETGESYYKPISMYSSELKTKQGWSAEYAQKKLWHDTDPEYEVSDIVISAAEHNELVPY